MSRDFTYIDDLVESIVRLVDVVPGESNRVADSSIETLSRLAPFRIVNIGGGQPVRLMDFVTVIEQVLERKPPHVMLPMQKGDVPATFASPDLLLALTGYKPATMLEQGVIDFIDWYLATKEDLYVPGVN